MHVVGPSKRPNEVHGCHNEDKDRQKQWERGWPLVITCGTPNNIWGHTSFSKQIEDTCRLTSRARMMVWVMPHDRGSSGLSTKCMV